MSSEAIFLSSHVFPPGILGKSEPWAKVSQNMVKGKINILTLLYLPVSFSLTRI